VIKPAPSAPGCAMPIDRPRRAQTGRAESWGSRLRLRRLPIQLYGGDGIGKTTVEARRRRPQPASRGGVRIDPARAWTRSGELYSAFWVRRSFPGPAEIGEYLAAARRSSCSMTASLTATSGPLGRAPDPRCDRLGTKPVVAGTACAGYRPRHQAGVALSSASSAARSSGRARGRRGGDRAPRAATIRGGDRGLILDRRLLPELARRLRHRPANRRRGAHRHSGASGGAGGDRRCGSASGVAAWPTRPCDRELADLEQRGWVGQSPVTDWSRPPPVSPPAARQSTAVRQLAAGPRTSDPGRDRRRAGRSRGTLARRVRTLAGGALARGRGRERLPLRAPGPPRGRCLSGLARRALRAGRGGLFPASARQPCALPGRRGNAALRAWIRRLGAAEAPS
jgi:hypothetical protein